MSTPDQQTQGAAASVKVDVAGTSDYRVVRFGTPAELGAELDRIAAADRAGTLRTSGNWSIGQILAHLAAFINYAYDGYPKRPGLIIRLVMRPMKRKFLAGPLPRGVRIPGAEGGTWGADDLPFDAALKRCRDAWARLTKSPPGEPNPLLGPLTHDEWIRMHLRHAELHLGYVHYS